MRYVDDQVYDALARVNVELAERGEPARVRFASIRPDPYLDDVWLVIATWELPDLAPDQDTWPLDLIEKYDTLTWESLKALEVTPLCEYRTRGELADASQLGRPVPELV